MKKLHIALCITELECGGAERCLVRLASGLDTERFEATVYCLAPRPAATLGCVELLEAAGVTTYYLGAKSKWCLPLVVGRLERLWKQQRPDVIQSFLFHANMVSAWAAHRVGIRPVVAGIRVAERRRSHPFFLERYTDRFIDRYVCVSRCVADFYGAKLGVDCHKLMVIPNGIDMQDYPPSDNHGEPSADLSDLGISPQRRLVCFVGRLDRQKGVDWLVATAGAWLAKLPDHDLLIVGKGPLRVELEKTARRKNIIDRVHFAGWRHDVPKILARSELLLLPSLWEGMPNVVLEAMASGRPVVAMNVEGVEELLGPSGGLQTVACDDPQSFAEKVVAFASNPQFAREIGRRNRARIERHFSLSRMICSYEQLWESLARGTENF